MQRLAVGFEQCVVLAEPTSAILQALWLANHKGRSGLVSFGPLPADVVAGLGREFPTCSVLGADEVGPLIAVETPLSRTVLNACRVDPSLREQLLPDGFVPAGIYQPFPARSVGRAGGQPDPRVELGCLARGAIQAWLAGPDAPLRAGVPVAAPGKDPARKADAPADTHAVELLEIAADGAGDRLTIRGGPIAIPNRKIQRPQMRRPSRISPQPSVPYPCKE